MYSGNIKGVGPRYCPSIEDKIVKFADKQGNVLKIGESGKLADRMFNQYKCIDNVTNNRIRESLKADYEKVHFFFFPRSSFFFRATS